ncbi:YbaY family lipoprotein [Pseudomonas sp. NPDC089395]|uniref:YbaY family lipoprotein n=1 Tax=Pseudomonas sp. NPDC089395 TaxID=3364460 RepID=UPI0037FB084E
MSDTSIQSLNIEIVASNDGTLPPSALVQVSLEDVSMLDAPAICHAQLRLRCAGTMPINLHLNYDSRQIDPRNTYALMVRIEQDGQLLYINSSSHVVEPDKVKGTVRVTVDKIDSMSDEIHDGNWDLPLAEH